MAGVVWPVDAQSGAPNYTGRWLRQTHSAYMMGATATDPFGVLPGVRPGTASVVTASSTTWTVKPHAGMLDYETSTLASGYAYSFDANVTGSVQAAPSVGQSRIDILSVQLNDPTESDGSASPVPTIVYTPGTQGTPGTQPATPARNMLLAVINVPSSGSPTVSLVAPVAVAAGGILPALSAKDLAVRVFNPYAGQFGYDQTKQTLLGHNGSSFDRYAPSGAAGVFQAPAVASGGVTISTGTAGVQAISGYSTLPFDSIAQVSWGAYVTQATATDFSEFDLRVAGSVVQGGRFNGTAACPSGHLDVQVAAGVAAPSLQTVITKDSGSGSTVVSPNGVYTYLNVTVIPA